MKGIGWLRSSWATPIASNSSNPSTVCIRAVAKHTEMLDTAGNRRGSSRRTR
jgi:hypothetical protein